MKQLNKIPVVDGRSLTNSELWNVGTAEAAALESTVRKARVGATAVGKYGGYLASGPNEYVRNADPQGPFSLHAEMSVLTQLLDKEHDDYITLYIVRVLRNGAWAMAKPCNNCESRLRLAGIDRVMYTISGGELGTMEFNS